MENNPLLGPMKGATHREVGGVLVDVVPTGNARVKRIVYPVGFRWSKNLKDIVGTSLCMHAHVGFLASGQINIQYADGAMEKFVAPQAVAIAPGHDGWVVGNEPAILIEFDFEGETVERMGLASRH
ncbi:cupin domain-containing protein [Hymenobacter ruber]